jgi:DNA polymerase-3 subunit beta
MKIVLLQSNFAKALNQVSRLVGTRTTLPVLSNILIVAEKGRITFSATDLEVGVSTHTVGKVEEEGSITLPARLLSDFVLNNKDESVELSVKETIAVLKSERYEATLHGISPEEFPTVPEPPKDFLVNIERNLFLGALKKVSIAPANDETRPVLAGVYFQFMDDSLILAATDSYRLAEKKITLAEKVGEKKIVVPVRTIHEVLRLITNSDSESVTISATDNQIAFKIGDTYTISRLIEGSFPNYAQIIPTSSKIVAKVKLANLNAAVKMTSLFAKETSNNNIKVIIKDKAMTISSASSQTGSAKSSVEMDSLTGNDNLEIAFNARYILEVLAVISDESIIMSFNDNSSACLLKPEKDNDFSYIIMPLKLDS